MPMHRDDFKALITIDIDFACANLPEYEEFEELRTQIQDDPDFYIEGEEGLDDFLHLGGAAIIAENITSALPMSDKEKEVLQWSLLEVMETLRLRYKARINSVDDEDFSPEYIQNYTNECIADLNKDLYEAAVNIVQLIMYLPEHMEHLKKFPVRNIPKFDWKP